MKIDRPELISQFLDFALAGSGLVIGQPGIGKSHAILGLNEGLKAKGIPRLIISVEALGGGTDVEVRAVLQKDGDFIDLLRSAVPSASTPAILIFDGFDAARGDKERAAILGLIKRAVVELKGLWNVVVSVRTFDANKSRRLLELFPDTAGNKTKPGVHARQFVVSPLTAQELEQAFLQIPGLRLLYQNGTEELRRLLSIPFNLWLVEQTVRAGLDISTLSQTTSEVQLLETYWEHWVRRADHSDLRGHILATAASHMVRSHTLAIPSGTIFTPEIQGTWTELLSDGVLSETHVPSQKISFSHNILFDFAVSAHLLDSDPSRLAAYIAADPARPLFLRPSLLYHFTKLWHFNRRVFWSNFWSILSREEIHLRQIIRLVLPAVVLNEVREVKDLDPLIDRLTNHPESGYHAIKFLMQALRVLGSQRHALWAEFISGLTPYLDKSFAWDGGMNITSIANSTPAPSPACLANCGEYARGLMDWAWKSRTIKEDKGWLERLVAYVAIPLIANTYKTDPRASTAALTPVLDILDQPDFPIDCIYRLTDEIDAIIPYDADFVRLVYTRIFGFEENSDAPTSMGGPVLPMTSNRKQDYGMCRYQLLKAFPSFLSKQPLTALLAGLEAVQAFGIESHVLKHLKKGKSLSEVTETFAFRGKTATYIHDNSAIWDQQFHHDREMEIADALFAWLDDNADADKQQEILAFLDLMRDRAASAFLWVRLLDIGSKHPDTLGRQLWELAKAKPFLESSDAVYPLGTFLETVYPILPEIQRESIERAILDLVIPGHSEGEFLLRRRNRLLARLEPDKLIVPDALSIRQSMRSQLPINEPVFRFSSSSKPYTEEDAFREQGIEIASPANKSVRDAYQPLKEWDKNKDPDLIVQLVPRAASLKSLLTSPNDTDLAVLHTAWVHLASFASSALTLTKSADSPSFPFLRDLVLLCAANPRPIPDSERDAVWNNPSWSPEPRTEAAQVLPWLTHLQSNPEILEAIERLVDDPVPSVRFLLACDLWRLHEHAPDTLWRLMERYIDRESNKVVWQGITGSLANLVRRDKERSAALILRMLNKIKEKPDDNWNASHQLVVLICDFAIDGSSWATDLLAKWRGEPVIYASEMSGSGHRLVEYIVPKSNRNFLEASRTLLIQHLDSVVQGLRQLQAESDQMSQEIFQKNWRSLYDVIDNVVTRFYFSADIDPALRQRKEHPLSDRTRSAYFNDILPVLDKILSFGQRPESGVLLAPTAHHFMELLNGVLRYDPPTVLRLAADLIRFSRRFNYNLDAMALREVVKLVESFLTDYREYIQDDVSITNILDILDAFVDVGWVDALNLIWRLDEIYR